MEKTIENADILIKRGPEIYTVRRRVKGIYVYDYSPYTTMADYSYCDNFWIVNNNHYATVIDRFITEDKCFDSPEELNQTFISLVEFMKDAVYIGKKFLRTKPVCSSVDGGFIADRSYCSKRYNVLALYKKDNLMIVKDDGVYRIINSKYIDDENYTFWGEKDMQYADKEFLCNEIRNQIIDALEESNSFQRTRRII